MEYDRDGKRYDQRMLGGRQPLDDRARRGPADYRFCRKTRKESLNSTLTTWTNSAFFIRPVAIYPIRGKLKGICIHGGSSGTIVR